MAEQPVDAGAGGVGGIPHAGKIQQRGQRVGPGGTGRGARSTGTDGNAHDDDGTRRSPAARTALAYAAPAMARPLTLLLVRHGQSEWNAAGRMQGQIPHVPLTPLGHAQAEAAAAELTGLGPGALISSDLVRAVQTAEHCARATGLAVVTTPALREQGYGELEGRPSRELWDVVDWTDPHWSATGGESLAELHGRVEAFLKDLSAEPPGDIIALVTHGDTIRAAQAVVAGLGPDAMPAVTPHNGSVTRLELIA